MRLAILLIATLGVGALPSLAIAAPASGPASEPAASGATAPSSPPKLLLVTQTTPKTAKLVAAVIAEVGKSERYDARPLSALTPLLRQHDDAARVLSRASALREEARKAMLALDHPKAQQRLDAALAILRAGFVELYEPSRVAQIELLRGVVALNRARPDLARVAFTEALHLDPTLAPDAHYRPQVRAAFAEAKRKRPARPIPRAELIARALAKISSGRRALVVAGAAGEGGLVVLRALQLVPGGKGYGEIEALTLSADDDKAEARAKAFAVKLRAGLELHYPRPTPKSQPTSRKVELVPSSKPVVPPPPGKPWYKRWYVWAVAGAVIGAAVVIPLATRRDVVDAQVSWGR